MRGGLGVALGVLALSGCGAQIPAVTQAAPAAGTYGQVAQVDVRNLFVLGGDPGQALPKGSAAPVYLALVNGGTSVDALEQVTSPEATGSRIEGGPIPLPPNQNVQVGPAAKVILEGVTQPVMGGEYLRLTLRFKIAGTGSFDVPILPRDTYWKTYQPAPA